MRTTLRNEDYTYVVEALIRTITDVSGGQATTLVTYEMPPDFEAFSPPMEGLSVAVDNIVVLRHRVISNEMRKTVWILKARGQGPDRQVREIAIRRVESGHYALEVRSGGLELYSNLLVGNPRLLKVSLHLFDENRAQQKFNDKLTKYLSKRLRLKVKTTAFSRPEMTGTLEETISPGRRTTPSDINIISLDEWWVREYGMAQMASHDPSRQLLRLEDRYLLSADNAEGGRRRDYRSEFWVFEVEKSSLVRADHEQLQGGDDTAGQQQAVSPPGGLTEGAETRRRADWPLETLALPNYQDYGLFCVNREEWNRLCPNPGGRVCWPPEAMARSQDSHRKELLARFLRAVPRVWVRMNETDSEFLPPDVGPREPHTIVDVLARARDKHALQIASAKQDAANGQGIEPDDPSNDGDRFVGFAFDMETPQTITCAFLEFCWSFGADEDFLVGDALRYAKKEPHSHANGESQTEAKEKSGRTGFKIADKHPALLALRFLQYLVQHKLMPARTTMVDCEHALFSRQWYSTLCELAEPPRGSKRGQKRRGRRKKGTPLFPIVFFPIGAAVLDSKGRISKKDNTIGRALKDATIRFVRLAKRVLAALNCRRADSNHTSTVDGIIRRAERARQKLFARDGESALPGSPERRADPRALARELRGLADEMRKLVLDSPFFAPNEPLCATFSPSSVRPDLWPLLPAARSIDARDILELLRWHRLRLQLIEAEIDGGQLADVVLSKSAGKSPKAGQETGVSGERFSALTGYPASGSWLIGTLEPVHSPGVAWSLVREITSLRNATKRSTSAAGIPSRKDFFEFHGHEKVKYAEHLTWSELLRYAGARARRRDRTICSACSVRGLTTLINHQVQYCLTAAAETCEGGKDFLRKTAESAVVAIWRHILEQMRRKWDGQRCADTRICPYAKDCERKLGRVAGDRPAPDPRKAGEP